MKLTEQQTHALTLIADSFGKSGRFWRDLGIRPQTIAILESKGLVGAIWRPFTGETAILNRSWHITEAGRAALRERE
nr:hypothetical protein [Brucella intermedia]